MRACRDTKCLSVNKHTDQSKWGNFFMLSQGGKERKRREERRKRREEREEKKEEREERREGKEGGKREEGGQDETGFWKIKF